MSSESPRDLRSRILDAAAELFAQQGYGSTSVREIAEAVGCTKPALYYHFTSKEGLYHEVVETRLQAVLEVVDVALAPGRSLRSQLRTLVGTLLQRAEQRPLEVRLLATAEHAPAHSGAPAVNLVPLHMELIGRLVGAFEVGKGRGEVRQDVDPLQAALALLGMVHIHVIGALYSATDALPSPLVAGPADVPGAVIDLLFSGLDPKDER